MWPPRQDARASGRVPSLPRQGFGVLGLWGLVGLVGFGGIL